VGRQSTRVVLVSILYTMKPLDSIKLLMTDPSQQSDNIRVSGKSGKCRNAGKSY
jgi:hypothetical protein